VDDRATLHAAAWALAAVVAVLVGMRLLSAEPAPPPAEVLGGQAERRPARGRAADAGPYIHVAGAVRRPGLYRLRDGARVAAAVRRAGGASRDADLTAINLAALLQDGQQVVVPALVPAGGSLADAGAGGGAHAGAATPIVSLGTATIEELDGLDGIGPTLAERIVEYRRQHGGFRSVDQLSEVDGIGAKRLETLKASLSP
jgi:competence protein ComEA